MVKLEDADDMFDGSADVPQIYAGTNLVYSESADTPYETLAATALVHYEMDETSGTVAANENGTDGAYQATVVTATKLATPTSGTAVTFDGSADFISNTLTMSLSDWTISVWVDSDDNTKSQYICDMEDTHSCAVICGFQSGYYNIFGATNYPTGNSDDTRMAMSATGTADHVAYVKTGSTIKGYLNGVFQLSVLITSGTWTTSSKEVRVGKYHGTSTTLFDGKLDEFMIYDSALTADEVYLLYSGSTGGPPVTGHFVSSSATTGGNDGTIENPWTLAEAFAHPVEVLDGETIYLRGGTYNSGSLTSTLSGSSGSVITVMPYPGEDVTIDLVDGYDLTINGSYTHYRDLEITQTGITDRETTNTTTSPPDINLTKFDIYGDHVKLINCVVHDLTHSLGFWASAVGSELYGNIIYNMGWENPGRGLAHNIYTQSNTGDESLITGNALFNSFGWGVHAYTSGGNIKDMTIARNTVFNSGVGSDGNDAPNFHFECGTSLKIDDVTINDNASYHLANGYHNQMTHGGATQGTRNFSDNYFAQDTQFNANWTEGTLSNNTVIGAISSVGTDYTPSTGFTATAWASRTGTHTIVQPIDDYEDGRALITIFRWSGTTEVPVDLDSVLSTSDTYAIYHVYALDTILESGTYTTGVNVNITMQSTDAPHPLPLSYSWTQFTQTDEFGCFLLRKTN